MKRGSSSIPVVVVARSFVALHVVSQSHPRQFHLLRNPLDQQFRCDELVWDSPVHHRSEFRLQPPPPRHLQTSEHHGYFLHVLQCYDRTMALSDWIFLSV